MDPTITQNYQISQRVQPHSCTARTEALLSIPSNSIEPRKVDPKKFTSQTSWGERQRDLNRNSASGNANRIKPDLGRRDGR